MSDLHFTGVFPILVTPFTDDEHIDLTSFERVDFMAQLGVDGYYTGVAQVNQIDLSTPSARRLFKRP